MPSITTEKQDHLICAHGLMILHMMFTHICASTIFDSPYYYAIRHTLSFFMAWFFFKSGMLYKERKITDVLLLSFKRLIIPAIVFSIIGFIYYFLSNTPETTLSNELRHFYAYGSFNGNFPLWFLFSLFVVQVEYSVIKKCHIPSLIIAILALSMYYICKYIGFRPYIVYNSSLGLFFYAMGNALKDLQYKKQIIIVCIFVYICLYLIHFEIDFLYYIFKPAVIAFPWALAGCILTNVLFKSFPCLCISPLRFFGIHAMEFYCTHIVIIYLIEDVFKSTNLHIPFVAFMSISFALYLIAFSLILHFFKFKHIQWMFGRSCQ